MSEINMADLEKRLQESGLVPTTEAAKILNNVSFRYVYYLTKRGVLHFQLLGGRRWYFVKELTEYAATHPYLGKSRAAKSSVE